MKVTNDTLFLDNYKPRKAYKIFGTNQETQVLASNSHFEGSWKPYYPVTSRHWIVLDRFMLNLSSDGKSLDKANPKMRIAVVMRDKIVWFYVGLP